MNVVVQLLCDFVIRLYIITHCSVHCCTFIA